MSRQKTNLTLHPDVKRGEISGVQIPFDVARLARENGVDENKASEVAAFLRNLEESFRDAQHPLTPRVKKALAIAQQISRHLNYTGIEHLLLAVLSIEDGAAADLLKASGINRAELLDQLLTTLAANYQATGGVPPIA